MTRTNLKDRTKRFAVDVFRFCETLPSRQAVWVISRQLMRSASSVAANYRAACRAHSRAAFIAKLSIVEEEADESLFWLEMLDELKLDASARLHALLDEANQLTAIIVTAKKSCRRNTHAGS
jgi:four helix bundle protein